MKVTKSIPVVMASMAIVAIFVYILFYPGKTSPPYGAEVIVKNSGGSPSLIAECANKSYLLDNSDVVVIGNVSKVESKQEDQIYTYSWISIENYEKGNLNSNFLVIKTTGGCMGTNCVMVEDQPILHQNKSVKVYLKQIGNEFSIVCGMIGVEEIGGI